MFVKLVDVADQEISIRAAGVVPLRDAGGIREVLVIHRPHRRDWSLPKGKVDASEHLIAAAVRECVEETGLTPTLGAPLPTQIYPVDGRLKSVHYWTCTVPDLGFVANDEVDEARWVPVDEARQLLTYEHDADLVDLAASEPTTSPLIILRHAQATKRADYKGPVDAERPLAMRGYIQAPEVADLLRAFGVTTVHSSPARRCMETVQPLADGLRVSIAAEPMLSEEGHFAHPFAAPLRLGELLHMREPMVVCSHRPVMPSLMDGLFGIQGGADWVSALDPRLQPGAFVVLHREFDAEGTPRVHAVERHGLTL